MFFKHVVEKRSLSYENSTVGVLPCILAVFSLVELIVAITAASYCCCCWSSKTRVYPIFINESGHPFVILNNSQWTEISNKSHNDSALGLVPLQDTSYPVTMNQQVTQVPTQSQQIMHHHFMTNQQQPLTQQQPMTQQQQPLTQQQQLQLAPQQFAQPQYHLTQQQYAALQQHQTMVQQQPGHTYAPTLYQQTPQLQTSVDSSNERPPSYKT